MSDKATDKPVYDPGHGFLLIATTISTAGMARAGLTAPDDHEVVTPPASTIRRARPSAPAGGREFDPSLRARMK